MWQHVIVPPGHFQLPQKKSCSCFSINHAPGPLNPKRKSHNHLAPCFHKVRFVANLCVQKRLNNTCRCVTCENAFTELAIQDGICSPTVEQSYTCKCGNCEKVFTGAGHLQEHLRTHRGERSQKIVGRVIIHSLELEIRGGICSTTLERSLSSVGPVRKCLL